MPRVRDPVWRYATILTENKWKCNFCGQQQRGVTRLKAHIAGVSGYGIKVCERVDVSVKAEVKDGLMPKKVRDSSDRGVSKDRIQRNVRAAPTSAFHPPNVEGGANLQLHLGVPPLRAESHELTEQIMPEERAVNIADLPLDGATSYSSTSPPPNSFFPNLRGVTHLRAPGSAPLRAQSHELTEQIMSEERAVNITDLPLDETLDLETSYAQQNSSALLCCGLLDNSSQNELEGSILPGPIVLDTQFTNTATTNTPQQSNQPDQSFRRQCGHGIGLSSPRASVDIEPAIPSKSYNQPPILEPFNCPPHIPGDIINIIGPSTLQEFDMDEVVTMTSHPGRVNNFENIGALKRKVARLYSREPEIRNELGYDVSLSLRKARKEVMKWLTDVEKLRNDFCCKEAASEDCLPSHHQEGDILMQKAEDLVRHGSFLDGLFQARETKFNKFSEVKMVGEAFERNTTKILEYLVGNQVSRLGIYGMGGVGKTTIMKHIHNRLLEEANYGNVLWITVSQDFNTQRLQDGIWEALGLDILHVEDVSKRAAMLSDCLAKRGKSTIILDDVWEHIDLKEVGIPIRADGFKLVLTTRSSKVCHQMQCQRKIKIEPLSLKEAEILFLEELQSEEALSLETKAVVKSIVEECAGLPLGVIAMARSMRGVTNVFEWKDCLEKLRESDMGQTNMEKVLMKLKFSYNRLGNHEIQQCFLSCALYPEDLIDKFELIEFFIDRGLIGQLNTRMKQYNRGLTILQKLEDFCLLEDHGSNIKMHNLIRKMALHIMSAPSIVKVGKGMMRIPPEEYWTETLEIVSLMENDIREFPLNMSPDCPKLSTCLLNRSILEDVIPDSFFKNLWGLKVLNMSGCNMTELPNSISDLVNLRALLLRECRNMRHIPYLGKLKSLRKLDARGCESLVALEGLEELVNLRYLDLIETSIERLPKGTLEHLQNLQCLTVWAVIEEDISKLRALETFGCYLENVDVFNKCVRVIEQRKNLCYYDLNMGPEKSKFIVGVSAGAQFGNLARRVYISGQGHAIMNVGRECAGIFILIPHDVQTLKATDCHGITNLSGMDPLIYLEKLEIERWENLGVLCGRQDEEVIDMHDSPAAAPTPLFFRSLRVLKLYRCSKLKYLFGHGSKSSLLHLRVIEIRECKEMVKIIAAVTSLPPHPFVAFPSLEEISVDCCDKMKRAVENEWMPHFPNLSRITVYNCENMEEIIGGPPHYMPDKEISLEFLDVYCCNNMRKLFPREWLLHLRNLRSIKVNHCKGMVEMISGAGQGQEESIMTPVNNTPSSFQPSSISLPKLEWLELCDLPQLKSICEVPMSCDSMKNLSVYECPELKGIPLQLRLRDIEDLPHIRVEDEEKWKMLMGDHPNAQALLQRYLRKGEHANKESPVPQSRRCSPNAIGYELIDI
ncbi:disease resistance protein RPS2 [Eucalyptus grandis]|uniref:disease resistance protein RPS2 n=1 Tax=Eucalyptus grandis TaxID=71139 RepID=UPI00192EF3F4|nr:disease resistance protein RPS2 [Eucalyptus grandis]